MGINKLKYFTSSLWITSFFIMLNACYEVPHFPDTPSIDFEKVEFHDVTSGRDSLLITISFTDGDGDLGLDDSFSEIDAYRANDYLIEGEDFYIELNELDELITIKDVGKSIANLHEHYNTGSKDLFELSTIPGFVFPYKYTNWIIQPTIDLIKLDTIRTTSGEIREIQKRYIEVEIPDTVFILRNINHFNFLINLFYKDKQGDEFKKFDWITDIPFPPGDPMNGRFPILQKSGDGAAIEGTLKYGFVSYGLLPLFDNKILKLEIQIQDRALNKSNVVESQEFTLRDIQVN